MKIRLERENDYLEVEKLVRNSFWNIYRPGAYEHYIVHTLRKDPSFVKELAYVIENDEKIIGHINYSYGTISYDNTKDVEGLILGPISIDNDSQKHGYGSQLIEYTLKLIENMNIPFVFVIGDENYYHRFGFESASKYNLFLEGSDMNDECSFFMIKIFDKDKINLNKGTFSNPDAFHVDEREVDEFDKKFEYKKKMVQPGQLSEM